MPYRRWRLFFFGTTILFVVTGLVALAAAVY
jgi:hypothetical protein